MGICARRHAIAILKCATLLRICAIAMGVRRCYLSRMSPADFIKSIEKRGIRANLTPPQLAARAVVDYATWWRIREGKGNPRWDTQQKLTALYAELGRSK